MQDQRSQGVRTQIQTPASMPWDPIIMASEEEFRRIVNETKGSIDFSKEKVFAAQAMMNNSYLADIARNNPVSLKMAFTALAATGLTLSPVEKQAYLIPRDQKIVLDISYLGMIRMAQAEGAIVWGKSELVYANDGFEYVGATTTPIHKFDPFAPVKERGELRGGYCMARLPDGSYLVDTMSAEKVYKVREKSEAWRRKKAGPWADWFEEMARKAIIRQAARMWPRYSGRLAAVIESFDEDAEASVPETSPTIPQPLRARVVKGEVIREVKPPEKESPAPAAEPIGKARKAPANDAPEVSETELTDAEVAFVRRIIARKQNAIAMAAASGEEVDIDAHWQQAIDFINGDARLSDKAKMFAEQQIETVKVFGAPEPKAA